MKVQYRKSDRRVKTIEWTRKEMGVSQGIELERRNKGRNKIRNTIAKLREVCSNIASLCFASLRRYCCVVPSQRVLLPVVEFRIVAEIVPKWRQMLRDHSNEWDEAKERIGKRSGKRQTVGMISIRHAYERVVHRVRSHRPIDWSIPSKSTRAVAIRSTCSTTSSVYISMPQAHLPISAMLSWYTYQVCSVGETIAWTDWNVAGIKELHRDESTIETRRDECQGRRMEEESASQMEEILHSCSQSCALIFVLVANSPSAYESNS